MSKLLLSLILFSTAGVAVAQTPTAPCACTEIESLKKEVSQLNATLKQLRSQVNSMEKDLLVSVIQVQLTREEIRGEVLQTRLLDIAENEAALRAQLEDINVQLQPGRIESSLAGVGSVHPEELRESIKARLLNERQKIQYKLNLLQSDRARSQSSLSNTDAAIRRLKIRLDEALHKQTAP